MGSISVFGSGICVWSQYLLSGLENVHSTLLEERQPYITTVSLLEIIFQNDLVIKNAPKPSLSDFTVLHIHKSALKARGVSFIT